MPTAKSDVFTAADRDLAAAFKALSHPARLVILRVLSARGACVCGEIVDELPLAQATVSQHLRVLKEAGMITGEIEGPSVCYCVAPDALQDAAAAMSGYLDPLTRTCCQSSMRRRR